MALTKPRAYQIYDIDYKQAVRVVTISNITLSGGAPNSVDGVSLSLNDRILVTGQSNGVQNGIYYVTTLGTGANGTWSRSIDTDTTGELLAGTIVMVTEGTSYADTQWKLTTNDPITIGSTALTFIQNFQGPILVNGTSNIQIPTANSNVVMSINGTPNVVVYASTGEYVTGLFSVTGNAYMGNILTNGYYYANGAAFGGGAGGAGGSNTYIQFNDNGIINGTAGFTFNKGTNAVATTGTFSATGNITGGNLSVTGNVTGAGLVGTLYTNSIINTGANSTGNIGSSTLYFNTAFVKATSAQYADVAEWYSSDAVYEPGTVVVFDGTAEVTVATMVADDKVAGVVSTNPAYIMNAGIQSEYAVPVALTGRVPTKVVGNVRKGNMMVSAGNGCAKACATPVIGTVIGKAIENFTGDTGIIEIVVGRM